MTILVIKGSRADAERELAARKIDAQFKLKSTGFEETFWATKEDQGKLADWLCEGHDAPFPAGALLYYS